MNDNLTYEQRDRQRAEEDARNEANFRQEPVTFPYRAHPQGDIVGEVTAKPQTVNREQVVHPAHYNSHPSGVECITIIQEFPLNIGTAVKYLWRAGLKNDNSYAQDLLKAQEYIDFELIRLGVKTSMPPVAEPNTATAVLRKGIPQHFLHYKGEVVHFHGELPDEIKDYLEQQSAGTSVVSDVSEGGVVTFDILPDDNYNSLAKGYDEDGKCKRSCCNPQV